MLDAPPHFEPLAILGVVAGGGGGVVADPRRLQEQLNLLLYCLVPFGRRWLLVFNPLLHALQPTVDVVHPTVDAVQAPLDALLHGAQELAKCLPLGCIGGSSGGFFCRTLERFALHFGKNNSLSCNNFEQPATKLKSEERWFGRTNIYFDTDMQTTCFIEI
jgi:hypothetical protein